MRPDKPLPKSQELDLGYIRGLLYGVQMKGALRDVPASAHKVLRGMIYDPLGKTSPESYLDMINTALKSNIRLSEVWGDGFPHSEELTRKFLRTIADHIESGTYRSKLEINDAATLPKDTEQHILKLMTPLTSEPTPGEDQIDALVEEIARTWEPDEPYTDAVCYALRRNVKLTRYAPPGWSEDKVREYLKFVGRKILDRR
jgi:hypothetical protein